MNKPIFEHYRLIKKSSKLKKILLIENVQGSYSQHFIFFVTFERAQ
jgi:hypothetical protein